MAKEVLIDNEEIWQAANKLVELIKKSKTCRHCITTNVLRYVSTNVNVSAYEVVGMLHHITGLASNDLEDMLREEHEKSRK